jgi:ADP-ribose pyrophosphatase
VLAANDRHSLDRVNYMSSVVFQGRKFFVEQAQHMDRHERPRSFEVVRHPGAAVILPLLDDGRVVLIRNHRPAVEQNVLELPAGTLDDAEPPEDCARRELQEETGYRASNWRPLLSFYSSPGFCDERLHAFLATGMQPGPTRHEASERITVTQMGYDQVLAAIGEERIEDGKTILTLLYYDRYVRGAE